MSGNPENLYQQFYKLYVKAFSNLKGQDAQVEVNKEWNQAKGDFANDPKGFAQHIQKLMATYSSKLAKKKVTMMDYLLKPAVSSLNYFSTK